jgi:phosphohistidine swiveling domain-containing protein
LETNGENFVANRVIQGNGASKGIAHGHAFRYHEDTVDELSKQSSIILLASTLDRSLCLTLPMNIAAVVASSGSIGAHGAGFLRELGIPCVVGCGEALNEIEDGEALIVDGAQGTVTITDKETVDLEKIGEGEVIPIGLKEIACYRPNRHYQQLRFDMLKDGWQESPYHLFQQQHCQLTRSDEGVVTIHWGPDLEQVKQFILQNPVWFFRIAMQREKEIEEIKDCLTRFQDDVNSPSAKMLIGTLETLITYYTRLLRYVYLTQFITDDLIGEWSNLAKIISEEGPAFIQEFLFSDYTRKAVINGDYPGESTIWSMPSASPKVWHGRIYWTQVRPNEDYFFRSAMIRSLESRSDILIKYAHFRLIIPSMYQMAEEHYFVSSSICSFINRTLDNASKLLLGVDTPASERSQIYNYTLEHLRTALSQRV